jgi:nucleoid-associated protein YgaU
MARYDSRRVITNSSRFYAEMLEKRGLRRIRQYNTPYMSYPSPEQISATIDRVSHLWKTGDQYWKLAHQYYGESELWWVIAWFNKKPTESHIKMGDTIHIPMPLNSVLKYLKG